MPKGIVDTPSKEKKWEKAKEIAAKQGKPQRWALVMHIFKQMGGLSKDDAETNIKIERALAAQGRKTAIPQEAHEVLHSWWQQNKDRLLSPKQKQALSDIKQVKERRSGIKLVKKQQYLNDMYSALSALKKELMESLSKANKPGKSSSRKFDEWSPSGEHTPEEIEKINKLIDEGWNTREAAHLISPSRGGRGEHKNINNAYKSNIGPTPFSEKMLSELKDVADQWLRLRNKTAFFNPEKNPVKHAAKESALAHESHSEKYDREYNAFINSPNLKSKKGVDRLDAIDAWKDKWHSDNPEYAQGLHDVSSQASEAHKQAKEARKGFLSGATQQIVFPGSTDELPSALSEFDPSKSKISSREAAEHVGATAEDEESKPQTSTQQSPYARFASSHPEFVEKLLRPKAKYEAPVGVEPGGEDEEPQVAEPEMPKVPQQPKVEEPEAQKQPSAPKTVQVIRRMAKPDQLERMQNVDAARMALKQKKD